MNLPRVLLPAALALIAGFTARADDDADLVLILIGKTDLKDRYGHINYGATDPIKKRCVVNTSEWYGDGDTPRIYVDELVARTAIHEFGHVMIGTGHPDDPGGISAGGPAPLQGTDTSRRLMHANVAQHKGKLLVKAEWDEIEKWLKEVADVNYRRHNNLPANAPTGNY